jgi:hypothetical protein
MDPSVQRRVCGAPRHSTLSLLYFECVSRSVAKHLISKLLNNCLFSYSVRSTNQARNQVLGENGQPQATEVDSLVLESDEQYFSLTSLFPCFTFCPMATMALRRLSRVARPVLVRSRSVSPFTTPPHWMLFVPYC